MATSVCFFNVNNLYLRYRFESKYAGDISGASLVADPKWGYLPARTEGSFAVYNDVQRQASAEAIRAGGLPDVLCLCEVENLMALREYNKNFLGGHYKSALLIDSYDFRQIDVGILSNKEILRCRTHVDDLDEEMDENLSEDQRRIFSRDCLEVVVALDEAGTKKLTIFINHLKSKLVVGQGKTEKQIEAEKKRSDERRQRQAREVVRILRDNFPGQKYESEYFMVVGDFNDQPASPWVGPLVREAGLYDALGELPEAERWTYWWKSKNRVSQIDYVLLSPALARAVREAGIRPRIERRGTGFRDVGADGGTLPRKARLFRTDDDEAPAEIDFRFERFASVLETRQCASDHCPVFLEIPG